MELPACPSCRAALTPWTPSARAGQTGPGCLAAAFIGRYVGLESSRGRTARAWGHQCERLTLWLLWLRGWELVGWNLKMGRYELDLLLSRGKELRLVEVKARRPGVWAGADTALAAEQRVRLQKALRAFLDRVPWPGPVTFQRVAWAGWRCRFHPPERWESLRGCGQ